MHRAKLGLLTSATIAVLAAAGLAIAHPGHPPITPPEMTFAAHAETIPFQLFRGNRIVIPVTVGGHRTQAILDTGASMTTLDRSYARSIGLPEGLKIQGKGTGGTVDAELVTGVTIDVGATRLANMSIGVMDLSAVTRSLGRPMTVVLGRDFFNATVVSIDWAASTLEVRSPSAFAPAPGAAALPLARKGPFNTISISVAAGKPIEALFDLGSDGALALPRSYWETRPDIANLRWAEARSGGVGGLTPARRATVPEVTLAGRTFRAVPTTLSEAGNDTDPTQMANVGIQFLKQFRLDLDLGRDRVFLTPRSDAPGFDRDRAGARFDLAGDRLKAVFVSPQGPAAQAGLKTGDEVVAVDGMKVDASFYQRADWTRGPVGHTVALARADGSTVKVTLADYF
ncbi:retropepsin-like aspartic protease [Sphingomonas sp. URHD0057]|uniref:retropepsin-like aspartic protease n=1 Tax=Sphingomonas sp. URHD0057 TaxID=1380389 RepID=UPI00048FD785|nr:aspartyl protease family protein [Sphingomonas sp. URHD0057]